jgi:hypothetical protein
MVAGFDERAIIGVETGFQSFFGRPGSETRYTTDQGVVDIEIIRGNEKIAAMRQRGVGGDAIGGRIKATSQPRKTAFSRGFPLIEEIGPINANQLLDRGFGENPYAGGDRFSRMRRLAKDAHQEHVRRMMRTREFLAAQSIVTGYMPTLIGSTTDRYDWRRNSANIAAAGTKWDAGSGVTIMADLDGMWDLGKTNGHVDCDFAIFGKSCWDPFLADADVIAKADNRRFELVLVNSEMPVPSRYAHMVRAGFTARGRLRTPEGHELWLFGYDGTYLDMSDTLQYYMPVNKVVMGYSGARADRYFGPPDTLPMIPQRVQLYQQLFGFSPSAVPMPANIKDPGGVVNATQFHFDVYVDGDWRVINARTQSAPIFAPTQTDAWVVLTDVV